MTRSQQAWLFFWVRMFLWGVLFGMITSCASGPPPPKYVVLPTLPAPGDVERLIPPPPAPVEVPPNAPRFVDRHVADCPGQPEGILTSRATYAERISLIAQGTRCAAEARALRQLRKDEHAAAAVLEAAYRDRVSELQRQVVHEQRMARWKLWGGLAAGAAVMLAATWAAGQLEK